MVWILFVLVNAFLTDELRGIASGRWESEMLIEAVRVNVDH